MKTNSLSNLIKLSKFTIKEISEKATVNRRTIEGWISERGSNPGSADLYKVCQVLGITVEQAIDGEKGQKYVQSLIPPLEISPKDRDLISKFARLKPRDQREILMLLDLKLSNL